MRIPMQLVRTPGRVHDHLGRQTLDLSTVNTLVLDEADRMTDMGFYDEIAGIVSACPKRRQTLLFSATYPDDIRVATEAFLADPVEVTVQAQHDNSKIEQRFYEVGFDDRDKAVGKLLKHYQPASAIAFCNTKVHCRELVESLRAEGFTALALYGELEQRERDEILVLFSNRSATVLVATDVAARGLDIANLEAVINVDVSKDTEVHIHRIGRTGRGDERGLALSLCAPNEKKWVKLIEEYQGAAVEWHSIKDLPDDEYAQGDPAPFMTLCILAGKKDKLRPGDVLSRIIWGGRVSLTVSFLAATFACIIGSLLGLVGGYFRGVIELMSVRLAEVILCFPPMLLALLVVTLLGPGAVTLVLVLTILFTPGFARVAYAETLSARTLDYVTAQTALGASSGRVLFRTLLPNITPPLLVQFSLTVAAAMMLESGLSFLGLGVVPPSPSWGLMIRAARSVMEQAPLLLLWPCLALAGTVLLLNVVCDR
eukprot:gene43694-54291_t